jgi:hypothetical protein
LSASATSAPPAGELAGQALAGPGGNSAAFLLGKGSRVRDLRCSLCGGSLQAMAQEYREFKLEPAVGDGHKAGSHHAEGRRLRLDTTVLVTGVHPRLAPMLEHSTNVLGERVLVGTPTRVVRRRLPYLFCVQCGPRVLAKVTQESRPSYRWDWVARTRRPGFANRWLGALGRLFGRRPRLINGAASPASTSHGASQATAEN